MLLNKLPKGKACEIFNTGAYYNVRENLKNERSAAFRRFIR